MIRCQWAISFCATCKTYKALGEGVLGSDTGHNGAEGKDRRLHLDEFDLF